MLKTQEERQGLAYFRSRRKATEAAFVMGVHLRLSVASGSGVKSLPLNVHVTVTIPCLALSLQASLAKTRATDRQTTLGTATC